MSVPVWAPSPWREKKGTHEVALLEVTATGNKVQVRDPAIGEVYLDTHVYTPNMFSLVVRFDANGVRSIEIKE